MNCKGYTLIQLPSAEVIIGILPAIAIPKFANTKAKAYIASMKSDLRNLVPAEEAYFADSVKYSAFFLMIRRPPGSALFPSRRSSDLLGVVGLAAGSGGWSVTITNNNLTTPLVKSAVLLNTAVLAPPVLGGAPPPQETGAVGKQIKNGGGPPPASVFLCLFHPSRRPRA